MDAGNGIPGRIVLWVVIFFLADVFSLAAYTIPYVGWFVFAAVLVGACYLLMRDAQWLIILPLAELFWGSFGMSFSWQVGGMRLTIRMLIMVLCVVWWLCKERGGALLLGQAKRHDSAYMSWLLLMGVALWATVLGLMHGRPVRDIFLDGNAYLYLLYFPVWASVWRVGTREHVEKLLFAAALALSVKTLILFNVFANGYELLNIQYLYLWIRDTRIGEITRAGRSVWRIFIQSQLFIGFSMLSLLAARLRGRELTRGEFISLAIMSAAFIASLSRSYWLGMVAACILALPALRLIDVTFGAYLRAARTAVSVALLGILFLATLLYLPYGGRGISDALNARLSNLQDPAGVSRLQQVGPLLSAIGAHAFLGSGFGTAVTYFSSDPRIKNSNNPSGLVTTYAFEWGYFDQLLKFGLLACAVWLLVLGAQFRTGIRILKADHGSHAFIFPMLLGLAYLVVVHAVSPYLNHPLGLGYLMLAMVGLHHFSVHEATDHQPRHL